MTKDEYQQTEVIKVTSKYNKVLVTLILFVLTFHVLESHINHENEKIILIENRNAITKGLGKVDEILALNIREKLAAITLKKQELIKQNDQTFEPTPTPTSTPSPTPPKISSATVIYPATAATPHRVTHSKPRRAPTPKPFKWFWQ